MLIWSFSTTLTIFRAILLVVQRMLEYNTPRWARPALSPGMTTYRDCLYVTANLTLDMSNLGSNPIKH